ncbi:MAG: glycine oxidase ThiO [Gammaproteobacteria bacterium]|nr:glycine oxidase ThiO [Gammaproteobacteria bacterium]MBU1655105.1 glycine oxidase ThiO [Gammaproteobacteria bacterium]MBU1961577.1 glycine oxidase ThiO [Gammaproteobacteria bacterium]
MSDILIIGGGIIGMLTARELRMGGADVTLLDRRETGREATWAGGGIISPLYPWGYADPITRLAGWGQLHYQGLALALEENTSIAPEWTPNGLLILDNDEQQAALAWARQWGQPLEILDGRQIAELEPALADPPDQAIWMPAVAQIRNPRLARALRQDIEKRGVRVREGVNVDSLVVQEGQVQGVRSAETFIGAEKVIVCTGAWTSRVLEGCSLTTEVRPVQGQMILFKAKPELLKRISLFQDHYSIPRRDGRILFGSTLEEVGFDKRTSTEAQRQLTQVALERFPALAAYPIEHQWAGLRPASPSGIPYIGPHPEIAGLFVNAGHFRNGLVMAPASCRLAADLILGRPPLVDPSPYALNAPRG